MEIGTVRQVGIVDEMREAYLDYAMSVITARALPDVRDGLKPVQRRILYAMDDMGLRHTQPHKKSARIVGEVLGKYHPHGDSAVYDAMVRMAQDFSLRYPLVDGHGNFGSVDGDSAAAMRYTEARLAAIAEEMLLDIEKDTVDFGDNFDGTLKEPRVLPARLPNLLINGGGGIAVGMATNIPPHNLAEVCDAISYLIDRYDELDDVTVEDLMQYIKGPDFPTGGTILGRDGIVSAYATGKGRIIVRARAHIEDLKGGRSAIVVTELPFQVNKSSLVERIADLVRSRRIETISDLRDESDRTGMRIVVELKRGSDSEATLNQLLKYTTMQTTFGTNMLALVDGEPRVLSLKRILQHFVEHRREVIRRRSEYDLAKARQRAHILEGLKIALDNLDEVINLIRRSRDADTAMKGLMRRFKLSEAQARAILDMQLRRLAALERRRIEEELAEVRVRIAYLEDLLSHPRKILALVQQEAAELRQKYGDARRTRIAEDESSEFSAEDLIASEDVFVVVTRGGNVKRISARSYRARGRGGATTTDEESPLFAVPANSMDSVLFFTDQGRVCLEKVHQVPDESRQSRGMPLRDLVRLDNGDVVTAVVPVSDFERAEYLVLATAQGKVKRSAVSEFSTARSSPMAALSLDEGDALRWVSRSAGGQEIMLVSAQGKAIRFSEEDVRATGRTAGGVAGMRLGDGDEVMAGDVVHPGCEVVVATERGHAKRSPLDEYALQGRGGSGLLTIDSRGLKQGGPIVALRLLQPDEDIVLASAGGAVRRVTVREIAAAARAGRPEAVLELKARDKLAAIVLLSERPTEAVPPPVPEGGAVPAPSVEEKPPRKGGKKASSRSGGARSAKGKKSSRSKKASAAKTTAGAKKAGSTGRTRRSSKAAEADSSAKKAGSRSKKASTTKSASGKKKTSTTKAAGSTKKASSRKSTSRSKKSPAAEEESGNTRGASTSARTRKKTAASSRSKKAAGDGGKASARSERGKRASNKADSEPQRGSRRRKSS